MVTGLADYPCNSGPKLALSLLKEGAIWLPPLRLVFVIRNALNPIWKVALIGKMDSSSTLVSEGQSIADASG